MKPLLILCICFALLSSGILLAGEYNFYFNSIEQGDDSKAVPSISVEGRKKDERAKVSDQGVAIPAHANTQSLLNQKSKSGAHWRLIAKITPSGQFYDERDADGYGLDLGYGFSRHLIIGIALNWMKNRFTGSHDLFKAVEVELVPFSFGEEREIIGLGFILGSNFDGFEHIHLGARLAVGVANNVSVMASYRGRSAYAETKLLDLGVIFRI